VVQGTANTIAPKYHLEVPPMMIAAINAKPATNGAQALMNRAARIALLILGHSAASGRMGRIVITRNEKSERWRRPTAPDIADSRRPPPSAQLR
jgi:hypothetical protein